MVDFPESPVVESGPVYSPRQADAFWPASSCSVINITTYRFGNCREATRADHMMRVPSAALLIHRAGQMYQWVGPDHRVALPRFALLGPSASACVYQNAPRTVTTLVNLAPGALQAIFGIDPRDLNDDVESLDMLPIADKLQNRPVDHEALDLALRRIAIKRCPDFDDKYRFVRSILEMMRYGCGLSSKVKKYADIAGVTPRTLQRQIRAAVGLTPKKILVADRLRRLLTVTASGWTKGRAELAQIGGFFDQSHLRYEMQRTEFGSLDDLVQGGHLVTQRLTSPKTHLEA